MNFKASRAEAVRTVCSSGIIQVLVCDKVQTESTVIRNQGSVQILMPWNKQGIQNLLQDKAYGNLTEETWETIATLTDWPELLKKKKRYQKTEEEGEGYDMDSAWKEILADERARGREEGKRRRKRRRKDLNNPKYDQPEFFG
ncbi:MAG: hypothetical protein V8S42_08450 [Lachnospiraceae bacterium]